MDFSVPILKTKLNIPVLKTTTLTRKRLIDLLNEGMNCKFTLISAPAGFGKTTLLTEWIQGIQSQTAWISLDERDNDLARFMKYLVSAIQTLFNELHLPSLDVLQAPSTPLVDKPSVEFLLISIINTLVESSQSLVLVLDDYHLITESSINQAMLFLMENMPQNMHLVLASRSDPPWPLARYRARHEMNELRVNDLRFNNEEAVSFITSCMNLNLGNKEIKVLETRTEGWIAGLQMAALSMRGRTDVGGYIHSLSGSNRFILDFLTEEVLEQQEEEVRDFLLKTSILQRLNAELCDAITQNDNGQTMLSMIDQSNLFILPMDNEREWFRYHNLFADLLRNMLDHEHPELAPLLHQRASVWSDNNGLTEEAIHHAFQAGDPSKTLKLIEKHARFAFMQGELNLLLKWFEKLPRDVLCSSLRACLDYAWALIGKGEKRACLDLIDIVESKLGSDADSLEHSALSGEIATIRAEIYFHDDAPYAIELSRQALEKIPPEQRFLRSIAHFTLATSYNISGIVSDALKNYPIAIELCRSAGNYLMAMHASLDYAMLLLWCGRINEAKLFTHQTLLWATEKQLVEIPATASLFLALGRIYYEQNELAKAYEYLERSAALSRKGGLDTGFVAEVNMIHVLNALGSPQEANALYEEIYRRIEPDKDINYNEEAFQTHRALLDIKQGKYSSAYQWAARIMNRKEPRPDWLDNTQKNAIAFALLAYSYKEPNSENMFKALETLDDLIEPSKEKGVVREVIRAEAVKAIILYLQGKESQAINLLQNGLPVAAAQGYFRIFIDLGEMILPLLRRLELPPDVQTFTNKIILAIQSEKQGKPVTSGMKEQPLVEPLSDRELEVLRLLTSSLTSTEIADELYIAASTVRSHIKSIYGKLNVHRRSEAVQHARELGLI